MGSSMAAASLAPLPPALAISSSAETAAGGSGSPPTTPRTRRAGPPPPPPPADLHQPRHVGQALLPDAPEGEAQLRRFGDQVGILLGARHLAAQHEHELLPPLGGTEEPPEQPEGVRGFGIDGEYLTVSVHGAFAIGEMLFHDGRSEERRV